jgi:ATP-binding cassette subfamily E protein 1
LKVSKFLRELADKNTAVLVVEHDLIILDYIADLIHIVYGKETEYGIFSGVKSSKAGINSYLSGMLKEENIQFRSKAINFGDVQAFTKQQEKELVEWNKETVTFGKFKLNTNNGNIKNNEIIGIVGENGIGKTCFVNLLAKKKIKISYKPQYLDSSSEIVRIVLKNAVKDTSIMKHLDVEHLLDKQLDQLSGGELQRVMIAKTLSEDADLVLMDEPSAYLDIEQRLAVSKLIDEHCRITEKAAIIVDHDLLFLDHISDNLLVFEGIPAEEGNITGPFPLKKGMNTFLEELDISFRRDEETNRPRANKPDSQMDRKQKQSGHLYA